MIFDKSDQSFVADAGDANRRADLINRLSWQRIACLGLALVIVPCGLLEVHLYKRPAYGGDPFALLFIVMCLYADAQVEALKLFGKLSTNAVGQ